MSYNEMFRVFDNGGETVDRYTVFLREEPEAGALGLCDNPTHPQGFSQWGDFDLSAVESNNTEITFDELPSNVQEHVIDRFEITEQTHEDLMEEVIISVMHGELDTARDLFRSIVSEKLSDRLAQPLNELSLGRVKFVGDDVIVNGKKVGTIENDMEDYSRGIVLKLDSGEEEEFEKVEDLMKHIFDVFRIKESAEELMTEATQRQKSVVKALRQLAKKLQIPKPRFRSLNGRAGFVEMSSNDGEIPNKLREQIVTKIFRTVPMNFSDVDYGNVTKYSIGLTTEQWKELLAYHGIDVPEPMMEGYRILPSIDRDRYQEREGLEGPFRARNGKVVYYDPVEGMYYDPDTDMFIPFDEWEEMDRDPELRRAGE